MSFSFVTAYFQFDPTKDEFYFKHFNRLVTTEFPIILYLDSKLSEKVSDYKDNKNVKIILMNWEDLYLNKRLTQDEVESLKISTGNKKDNAKFLILMNSKSEFLKLAMDESDSPLLIWVDFCILKLTDDLDHFKRNFLSLKNITKIMIPGGFFDEPVFLDNAKLFNCVYWRFLGGVLICPRELIVKFNDDHYVEMEKLFAEGRITWEVNYWCNIEYNNPEMIHYYRADHTKTMFGFNDTKLMLLSMIKNEEKIIIRCIETVRTICDALCVTDTGSTDNTVKILSEHFHTLSHLFVPVPCKIYHDTWRDFGSNRTVSYNNAVKYCKQLGWNPEKTYGLLLDADMKLIVTPLFNKQNLTHNGYKIIQGNGNLEYHNTRFVKLNGTWKSTGVTHEYWDGPDLGTLDKDIVYINDVGDGGCKDDKFQRDMKLLIKGIEDEPENGRYHFYLAQTCKDLGKFREAIRLYKRRIEIGGWDEEVWYAHYMIAKCWILLGNIEKSEYWALKAYQYRKSRAEPIYFLTNLFRDRSQHYKAYHYYKIGKSIPESFDSLFVEKNVYNYMFDYEWTILQYWVFPNERLDGLKHSVNYLNNFNHHEENVLQNIDFYIQRLGADGKMSKLDVPVLDDYTASSPSIIMYNNKLIVNVRYVNYRIQHDGSYLMYENGKLSRDHNVKTKNGLIYLDNDYNILTNVYLMDTNLTDIPSIPTYILGLEDIRLFNFKDKIHYVAVSKEFSYNDNIRIVLGEYDINKLKHLNNHTLYPPEETVCEKNWIPINHKNEEMLFIYNWHPLRIGKLDDKYKLNITITHDTPKFWKHYRGSTNVCEYNNQIWCITHGVKYSTPRKYFHQFVILEKDTYKPLRYTTPLYFNHYAIEYCVGLYIKHNEAVILFSQNDKDPFMLRVPLDKLDKYFLNV